jgi:hypothetical protein
MKSLVFMALALIGISAFCADEDEVKIYGKKEFATYSKKTGKFTLLNGGTQEELIDWLTENVKALETALGQCRDQLNPPKKAAVKKETKKEEKK